MSTIGAVRQETAQDLLVKCGLKGCMVYFAPTRGKRFCCPPHRAQASIEARYIRKPVKRRPEMTPERKFYKCAAVWLLGKLYE